VVEVASVEELAGEDAHEELEEELGGPNPTYRAGRVRAQEEADVVVLKDTIGVRQAKGRKENAPTESSSVGSERSRES